MGEMVMYRKKMMTFLLALFMVAMSIGSVSAEGLLDPPIITMTIVGDYVFSNDIPDPYCQSLNGLFYDGKSLTASDFSILNRRSSISMTAVTSAFR